jgi:FkbM family methyltransferase
VIKNIIKWGLNKIGAQVTFKKNLWYLNDLQIIKNKIGKPDPVIFDIGACDGHFTFESQKYFPAAHIFSFEPFPDSYQMLVNNTKECEKISTHQLALSNSIGSTEFYVNASKATNSLLPAKFTDSFIDRHLVFEKKITVETTTIDAFVKQNKIEHIDILKLDVQGGELMIFQGAKEMLSGKRVKLIYSEIWFIEGYVGQPLYHDIASYLAGFGYLPFGIYNMHYRADGHFLWGDAIFYLGE